MKQITLWLSLAGILLSTSSMGASVGCAGLGCRIDSQNQINWEQKPEIVDGYLEMRGTTKGDKNIHDATSTGEKVHRSAFDLYNYNQESEDDPAYLEEIGAIWPESIKSEISGKISNIIAERYEVTPSSFDIRAKLPQRMLRDNVRIVVGVWQQHPDMIATLDRDPLGAACAIQQPVSEESN